MVPVGDCDAVVGSSVGGAVSGSWASRDSTCTNRYMRHRTRVVAAVADIVAVGGNDCFACESTQPERERRLYDGLRVAAGCLCSDRIRRCCVWTDDCAPGRNSATLRPAESWVRLRCLQLELVIAGPVDASTDLWRCVRLYVGSLVAALAAIVCTPLRSVVFSMAMLPYCCWICWPHPRRLEAVVNLGLACCYDCTAVVRCRDVDSRFRGW